MNGVEFLPLIRIEVRCGGGMVRPWWCVVVVSARRRGRRGSPGPLVASQMPVTGQG